MKKIFLKYNPYKLETEIKIDGKPLTEDNGIILFQNEMMQVWLVRFMPVMEELCNDESYEVEFYGTDLDYEDLRQHITEYVKESKSNIKLNFVPAKNREDKLKDLEDLFNEMQNGPIEDLKKESIRENFKKALSSEFEISVIATVSAGKSTIINSLLEREIMPSKHEACTAKISRIKDIDEKETYSARCWDKDGNIVCEEVALDLQKMKEFNENNDINMIEIEGDIPFSDSKHMNLVFIDTPGPNNSLNSDHRDNTYRIIKDTSKPIVLYVLDAGHLGINDDKILLTSVAEVMKLGGKQSKDRFIFVLNKLDQYDVEKDDNIDTAIKTVKEHLAGCGIKKPNLYLTSGEIAKVIRMHKNGIPLTKAQKRVLSNSVICLNEEPKMHLTQYSSLAAFKKQKLHEQAQKFQQGGDDYEAALIHSGIPAVEEAINEYLEKYAIPTKIRIALDTFKKEVEVKKILDDMLVAINNGTLHVEEMIKMINHLTELINEGTEAKKFKERIENLSFDEETEEKLRQLKGQVENELNEMKNKFEKELYPLKPIYEYIDNKPSSGTFWSILFRAIFNRIRNDLEYMEKEFTIPEIEECYKEIISTIEHVQSKIFVELEIMIDTRLKSDAQNLIGEYSSYIQSLINSGDITLDEYKASTKKYALSGVPDMQQLISRHEYTKIEQKAKWVENKNKKWYKPWTRKEEDGHYDYEPETKHYVRAEEFFDDFLKPVRGSFYQNMINAQNHANEESQKLKNFFTAEIDKLDKAIIQKLEEMKELISSKNHVEAQIEANREKMAWLKTFNEKIEAFLEI